MKLINTDGMAFIGPGSEWFWTALSGIILAVTFVAIYRQLRLQRSAGAREQLASSNREWGSERMLRHRLAILVALREGADPANVPLAAASAVTDYWDGLGELTREGHLEQKVIDVANCQLWWATLEPFVRKGRIDWSDPLIGGGWEWLVEAISAANLRDKREIVDYRSQLAEKLGARISATEEQIRVEQALRTVILASPEAPPSRGAGRSSEPAHGR